MIWVDLPIHFCKFEKTLLKMQIKKSLFLLCHSVKINPFLNGKTKGSILTFGLILMHDTR